MVAHALLCRQYSILGCVEILTAEVQRVIGATGDRNKFACVAGVHETAIWEKQEQFSGKVGYS
jgi:hypothetical protein